MTITEGDLLWQPPAKLVRDCTLQRYLAWLGTQRNLRFASYAELWEWSASAIEPFWESIWQFFAVRASAPYQDVLPARRMPGAEWFPGARLSYAEHIFRHASAARPAIVAHCELRAPAELSWAELERQTAAVADGLRVLGVQPGDRVVAYLPNIPEAVVAFLACASIGAIWSSCSPDMGSASVLDRFRQIEPKVLFAIDGYQYGGKPFDRRAVVAELAAAMPSLAHVVLVPYLHPTAAPDGGLAVPAHAWAELVSRAASPSYAQLPFDHPLWVLYSSGTTGLPKPIVQGQGGILLEHLKSLALHLDLGPDDRFFWFSTTGWMMWNFLVGGLLVGSTILLYDGSPGWPNMGALWAFAERTGATFFGTSAAYIAACMKAGLAPRAQADLRALRGLGSTGSPLTIEGFAWVYEQVKPDIWLASISGGTDLCTAFVGGCPLLPVYAGEIQCRCLGAAVHAFDDHANPVREQVGELVISEPMPSMPLYFWNDPGGARYRESYFELYPNIWRHGDWMQLTAHDGVIIYGRSDATINRMGIRMGTSEIYRVVEAIPEVLDSLVIDLEYLGRPPFMPLFVVLRPGVALDDALKARINASIRSALSARHVPNTIIAIAEVPRTLSGKKMELPIKKILLGADPRRVANPDSMANPHTIAAFAALASELGVTQGG